MRTPWKLLTALLLLADLLLAGLFPRGDNMRPVRIHAEERKPSPHGGYDRPAKNARQSRSAVVAQHGMVATSQPLATLAGLEILKQGGTAADAAIAANAVLGVVEPMSCGIGGDLFVLYWDAKSQQLYGLNASGRSPRALSRDAFQEQGLETIPVDGPLSWSVPGCVSGWEELRGRSARCRCQ